MTIRAVFVPLLVLLVVAPCVAPSQVTKSGSGYLLRMKLTKGASYAYDMTSSTSMGTAAPMSIKMGYSMKVTKVTNGIAEVLMTSTTPMSKTPQTQTVKMDGRGALDGQPGTEQVGNVRMPEKAIKVGETWVAKRSMGTGAQATTIDTVYTFRGLQAVGKVQCAVLDVKTTSKGMIASTTTGKMFIEAANGMLLSSNLSTTATMKQGGTSMAIKSTTSIKRK